MKLGKGVLRSDLERVDARGVERGDYEEIPELDDHFFEQADEYRAGILVDAQRCIMEALDRSSAAETGLMTDAGEHPSIALSRAPLLGALSEGRQITLVPADRESTTVEAANFLNVSRPFVIKEIEAGRLKHRMVGTHRRIAFEDLVAYARQMREKQFGALDKLAANNQELGLDY